MIFRQLFDRETCTYTYLLGDRETGHAVLIDPVREHVERDVRLVRELGLKLVASVETHVHADHVTGAWGLKQATGCDIVYPAVSGVAADRLVADGDWIVFGSHALEVRSTPGHTSGCTTYVTDDATRAFTGDALLIRGCGRTDFQEGDSATLYASVHDRILSLPDATALYPGHDYKGRTVTTVGEERAHNPRLGAGRTLQEFAAIMDGLGLAYPRHIDEALPANLRLGRPPVDLTGLARSEAGARRVDASWVRAHADFVRLIDVREPDEFNGPLGHVPGVELVPLESLPDAAASWERAQPIVTICRSAGRSDRAACHLEAQGFQQVASMTGGMMGWS